MCLLEGGGGVSGDTFLGESESERESVGDRELVRVRENKFQVESVQKE